MALVAVLWAAPACNDAADGGGDAMAELTKEVKEARRLNERMSTRIERIEKKMDGFRQDVDRLGREKITAVLDVQNAAEEAGTDEAASFAAASAMGGPGLAAALNSDEGLAALAKAVQSIEDKRNTDRRQRMVSGMVDRFAQEANLSPAQTEDVNRILGESMKKIGGVWSSFRDAGGLSADERAAMRDDNMAKMEEIRGATNDEMKGVLNADQYSLYEEQAQRMRGGFGGGRGGGRTR